MAGAGSILGSKSQSKAAKTAANSQLQVAQQNNALARDIYGQNKEALSPFMQRGNAAGNQINALLGIGGAYNDGSQSAAFDAFRGSTGYNFRLNEGANALNGLYAGAGTLQSGAAAKSLMSFGQDMASQEFGNYLNQIGNQQGIGLSGASALAGVGQNYVGTVSANNQNAGDAAANAALIRGANNPFANSLSIMGGGLFGMAR